VAAQPKKYNDVFLKKLFSSFEKLNVLVVGDVMLDHYMMGKVNRISPEAPVPVVNITHKEFRLGGAANVLANLQAMGCNSFICSVVGDDIYGSVFCNLLEQKGLTSEGIVSVDDRQTTVKTRVIGNNHQLIRIDEEQDEPINKGIEKLVFNSIIQIIEQKKIDVIILEDYDKGLLSATLIKKIIDLANKKNIPTAVDPKKRNFTAFKNCTLFKPNLKELKEGLKIEINASNSAQLEQAATQVLKTLTCKKLLLTLSEHGVYLYNKTNKVHLPAHLRSIADVSGAGDTVISLAALCLAAKTDDYLLAALSNMAGGLVCEHPGVVPINKEQLQKEAVKILSR